ncbi:iron-containing alcohol dehydrogenase [Streptomyces sp. NRRL WC-3742]|uniref:iron-containing alcohol dehydrogenase n=1 Tax=Streptomyces sp. NRRL WC-3742 TaxID=1463934 RepID=UPI00068C3226|nr:iron-containing alcohol dehydrogenase [Streptomyces sp. NRRL WC-3742]
MNTATLPPMAMWQRRTRLHLGAESGVRTLAQGPSADTVLMTDRDLPEAVTGPLAEAARVASGGRLRTVTLDPRALTLDAVEELADTVRGSTRLVAVGGGSVLDAAALARLLSTDGQAARRIRHGGPRPGLVALAGAPAATAPHEGGPELVAVPTTVGTAAEVSSAATVLVDGARKLVMAEPLAADLAVLDPQATATLPTGLLLEGVLEALCRLLNTYLPEPGPHVPRAGDAEACSLLVRLAGAGHEAAPGQGLAPAAAPPELRTELALLSAQTVLGWSMLGRDPFVGKVWYLANELSLATGARKMSATVLVLPAVWARVLAGDTRLGDAGRLRTAWQAVRTGIPDLPEDPPAGIAELARRWGVPACRTDGQDPAVLAARAARVWGAGLPMLGAFRTAELTELYTDVLEGAPAA